MERVFAPQSGRRDGTECEVVFCFVVLHVDRGECPVRVRSTVDTLSLNFGLFDVVLPAGSSNGLLNSLNGSVSYVHLRSIVHCNPEMVVDRASLSMNVVEDNGYRSAGWHWMHLCCAVFGDAHCHLIVSCIVLRQYPEQSYGVRDCRRGEINVARLVTERLCSEDSGPHGKTAKTHTHTLSLSLDESTLRGS